MLILALTFEYKSAFALFLLLIPLMGFALRNFRVAAYEIAALKRSIVLPEPAARWIKRMSLPAALFFVVLALLGPKGNPHYSEKEIKQEQKQTIESPMRGNLVLLVDTSNSMLATDTPSRETRFAAAKELADELIGSSLQSNLVLYAFGGDLIKVVPRTLDKVFTRLLLKQMQVNDGGVGTDFLEAFKKLGEDLKEIPDPVSIILFTDGDDTALEGDAAGEKQARLAAILKAVVGGKQRRTPIYTVGFGTPQGAVVPHVTYKGNPVTSHLGSDLLAYLSQNTEGKTYVFNENDPSSLVQDLVSDLEAKTPLSSQTALADPQDSLLWDLYFQLPLFVGILFLILYLTWPDTSLRKGALMLALISGSTVSREVEIYLEVGDSQQAEAVLEKNEGGQLSPWENEAILFNRAILKVAEGNYEEAEELFDRLNISPKSSPYVLEKLNIAKAAAALGQAEKEPLETRQILLIRALYLLRDAEEEACEAQKEKGYQDCFLPYEIDQLKKLVKGQLASPQVEKDALFLLALVLEWIERIKLVQEYPGYYEAFLKDFKGELEPRLREALNYFKKKDFSGSLADFEKEKEKLTQEVAKIPLLNRIQKVLQKESITPYDIEALSDPDSDKALKLMQQGERLESRLLLIARQQELKAEGFKANTPEEVLENSLDMGAYTILLQTFSKEIPGFKEGELLKKGQAGLLKALSPFISVSEPWRVKQFLEKGRETAPWNQIIPLYEKAYKSELSAGALIAQGAYDPALVEQKKGFKSLKEALKWLKNPPSSSQSPSSLEADSDTLRIFQDLEIADQPAHMKLPSPQTVEKPW